MARNPSGGQAQINRGVTTTQGIHRVQQPSIIGQNARALGLGAARTATGIGQGLSGLADLATPGTGTSRVTKALNNAAVGQDNAAKKYGVSAGYKTFQAPLNVATFLAPGAALHAAGYGAKTAEVAQAVPKATALGRIGAATVKGTFNKSNALNAVAGTAMQQGHKTAMGHKVTPLGTAADLGINVAFGGALAGGGQAGLEAGRGAIKGAKAATKGIEHLAVPHYAGLKKNQVIMDTRKLDTIHNFLANPESVPLRQDTIDGLHRIKTEHNIDLISGTPNDRKMRAAQFLEQNGEAIPQLQARMQRNDRLLMRGDPAVAQGGYIRLPGGKQVNKALYHGSPAADIIRKEGFKEMSTTYGSRNGPSLYGKGTYLTTDKSLAQNFTKGLDKNILRTDIPKDARILKVSPDEAFMADTQKFKDQGYDGIEIQRDPKHSNIVMFDPSKIKARPATPKLKKISNLTDEELDGLSPAVIEHFKKDGFTGVSNGKRTVKFDEPGSASGVGAATPPQGQAGIAKRLGLTKLDQSGHIQLPGGGKKPKLGIAGSSEGSIAPFVQPKGKVQMMTPDEYIQQAFKNKPNYDPTAYPDAIKRATEYAEAMKRGDKFPAPSLSDNAQDGFHRAFAAKLNGVEQIPVEMRGSTAPVTSPSTKLVAARTEAPVQPQIQQPKVSGEVPVKSSLPEYGTKKVSNLDKATRSTSSIIERQGETGRVLASDLEKARGNKELTLADWESKLPNVMKLARKDKNRVRGGGNFENFVEATQGRAKPANAEVAAAVKEWQAFHPEVRNRGVGAGLEIGDLGQTYYPHFVDYDRIFKDKNTFNEAINHLVESGQAPDGPAAIKLLSFARDTSRDRQFGNLESERLVDLPFYDKSPNSLISYLNGSAKRIANTETFGAKDEKALKLINQIGQEGGDTQAAKEAFDVAVGAKKYSPTTEKISGNIRKYTTTTRLGLGALTNASQSVNTGIVTGHLNTLKNAVGMLSKENQQFAHDTGVISDAVLSDMRAQQGYKSFSSKVFGNAVAKITAPGFSAVEKFNRSLAANAGRDYALRLAQKGDEKALRKLGVTGKINGTLNQAQQIQAARTIVKKTQFKVDPQDLPGWSDSPGGKLVSQFRTFSYKQGSFVSNEILKPAAKGNVLPLGRFLAALPVGYGLYEARRAIDGRPGEDNGPAINTKEALASASKIGGFGLVFDLYQSINPVGSQYIPTDRRATMTTGAVLGPSFGTASQGVAAASELVQRKNTPKDTTGKLAVGNTGEKYTDATPAARFALSQVPVIGSPIKNRLLPYKKESDASGNTSNGKGTTAGTGKTNATLAYGKDFGALKNDTARKEWAAKSPENRAIYEQAEAAKTGNKAITTLRPEGMSADSTKTLDRYERLTTKGKDAVKAREKDAEYKIKLAEYERDSLDGTLSQVEDIKRQKELAKAKVGAGFSKDVRELYGMNKTDLYDFLSTDPNGKKLADDLVAYDDAIVAAGVGTRKLRNKNGAVAIRPSTGGSGGGRGKSLSSMLADFNKATASEKDLIQSRTKGANLARSAKLAKKRA